MPERVALRPELQARSIAMQQALVGTLFLAVWSDDSGDRDIMREIRNDAERWVRRICQFWHGKSRAIV
jgi:hypothetical protein